LDAALAQTQDEFQDKLGSLESGLRQETEAREQFATAWDQRFEEILAQLQGLSRRVDGIARDVEALTGKVNVLSGSNLDVSTQLAAAFNQITTLQRDLDQVKREFSDFRAATSDSLAKFNKNLWLVGGAAGLLGMFVK
jgi:chromosome segregation ATPase